MSAERECDMHGPTLTPQEKQEVRDVVATPTPEAYLCAHHLGSLAMAAMSEDDFMRGTMRIAAAWAHVGEMSREDFLAACGAWFDYAMPKGAN